MVKALDRYRGEHTLDDVGAGTVGASDSTDGVTNDRVQLAVDLGTSSLELTFPFIRRGVHIPLPRNASDSWFTSSPSATFRSLSKVDLHSASFQTLMPCSPSWKPVC